MILGRARWMLLMLAVAVGALVAATSSWAASISITAPASAARDAPLSLTVSGVAPAVTPGSPPGAQAFVDGWIQPVGDGACAPQAPDVAPQGAWGVSPSDDQVAPGVPFSMSWRADSSFVALGGYYVCAWVRDNLFHTAAAAQALVTIRPPTLVLSVAVPRHARVGTRGNFVVSASLEAPAQVGVLLLPPRSFVCDISGTRCKPQRLSRCPASYAKARDLAGNIQAHVTLFTGADFGDPPRIYQGHVRFHARLKALSPGLFHFCAYALENSGDAPPPFAEGHAFAAFRVVR